MTRRTSRDELADARLPAKLSRSAIWPPFTTGCTVAPIRPAAGTALEVAGLATVSPGRGAVTRRTAKAS